VQAVSKLSEANTNTSNSGRADLKFAVEIKYDKSGIRESKYRKFSETYPYIPLKYNYLQPFDEDFFRRMM
jgi:hypothetical protein